MENDTFTPKPLPIVDIAISIFNQEEIIERVLYSVFRNTTTPFNLVLVFDGCFDRTKPRALDYIKKAKPRLMANLIVRDTPNLFELRANNFAWKLASTPYLITLQDDMVIREYGWERRITFPLRIYDDVFAVTGREAHDIRAIAPRNEEYFNRAAFELGTLSRDIFAIRDLINRGPIAFHTDRLKELDYLNDRYAPGAHDDTEISLRAWIQKGWKVGAFGTKYLSKKEWSKVNAPDSTMKAWDSCLRNQARIYEDFKEYIDSGKKHTEDRIIGDMNVDYHMKNSFIRKAGWLFKYPMRIDKRRVKTVWNIATRKTAAAFKFPLIHGLAFFYGKDFIKKEKELGLKKALLKKK